MSDGRRAESVCTVVCWMLGESLPAGEQSKCRRLHGFGWCCGSVTTWKPLTIQQSSVLFSVEPYIYIPLQECSTCCCWAVLSSWPPILLCVCWFLLCGTEKITAIWSGSFFQQRFAQWLCVWLAWLAGGGVNTFIIMECVENENIASDKSHPHKCKKHIYMCAFAVVCNMHAAYVNMCVCVAVRATILSNHFRWRTSENGCVRFYVYWRGRFNDICCQIATTISQVFPFRISDASLRL